MGYQTFQAFIFLFVFLPRARLLARERLLWYSSSEDFDTRLANIIKTTA